MRGGMTDPPSGIVGLMRGFLYPVKDARIIAELALYVAVTRVAIRLRALVRRPRRREGDRHGGRRPHARRARVRLGGRYGLCATGVSVPECWHYRERERDPKFPTLLLCSIRVSHQRRIPGTPKKTAPVPYGGNRLVSG